MDACCALPAHRFCACLQQPTCGVQPLTESDLDTGTTFVDNTVGFDCQPAGSADPPYLQWSGDDVSAGGRETVVVDVSKARQDGAWSGAGVEVGRVPAWQGEWYWLVFRACVPSAQKQGSERRWQGAIRISTSGPSLG